MYGYGTAWHTNRSGYKIKHLTGMRTNKLRPIKKKGGEVNLFFEKKKNTKIKREQGAYV